MLVDAAESELLKLASSGSTRENQQCDVSRQEGQLPLIAPPLQSCFIGLNSTPNHNGTH